MEDGHGSSVPLHNLLLLVFSFENDSQFFSKRFCFGVLVFNLFLIARIDKIEDLASIASSAVDPECMKYDSLTSRKTKLLLKRDFSINFVIKIFRQTCPR